MTIPKETNIKWAKVGNVRNQGSQLTGEAETANLQSTRNAESEETWTIVAISSVGLIHLRKVRCPDDAAALFQITLKHFACTSDR